MIVQLCPRPKNFDPVGPVEWVTPLEHQPPFITRKKRRGRRALGIKYELRGHDHFFQKFGEFYFPSQWWKFKEVDKAPRWCQTDGLLIDPYVGLITVLEFKYQHTSDAWWQLRKLYLPVVSTAFGFDWEYSVCEVVKWYDPSTAFPERVKMAKCPSIVRPGEFGVHIWKP